MGTRSLVNILNQMKVLIKHVKSKSYNGSSSLRLGKDFQLCHSYFFIHLHALTSLQYLVLSACEWQSIFLKRKNCFETNINENEMKPNIGQKEFLLIPFLNHSGMINTPKFLLIFAYLLLFPSFFSVNNAWEGVKSCFDQMTYYV